MNEYLVTAEANQPSDWAHERVLEASDTGDATHKMLAILPTLCPPEEGLSFTVTVIELLAYCDLGANWIEHWLASQ